MADTGNEHSENAVFVRSLTTETSVEELTAHVAGLGLNTSNASLFSTKEGTSKGCALLTFGSAEDADAAIAKIDGSQLNGNEIHARADKGPTRRAPRRPLTDAEPADATHVFIGNLSPEAELSDIKSQLSEVLGTYGQVDKLSVNKRSKTRGRPWASAKFSTEEEAAACIEGLNGSDLSGNALNVTRLLRLPTKKAKAPKKEGADAPQKKERKPRAKKERKEPEAQVTFDTQVFAGNVDRSIDDDKLNELFAPHGNVVSAKISIHRKTKESSGWGYIEFSTAEEAQAAIDNLNGVEVEGRALTVALRSKPKRNDRRTRKKTSNDEDGEESDENQTRRRRKAPREPRPAPEPRVVDNPDCHLFVGNLSLECEEGDLKEHFSQHGNVKATSITRSQRNNRSRGWGTVEFADADSASAALNNMNKTDFQGRNIVVRMDNGVKRAD